MLRGTVVNPLGTQVRMLEKSARIFVWTTELLFWRG